MQPYQKASEALKKKSERDIGYLKKGAKAALNIGSTATGAIGGSLMLSRALPFLAEGITPTTVIAGLKAINPKFGKFIEEGLKQGTPLNEIKNFISEKIKTAQNTTTGSLFRRLAGDIDFAQLDEKTTKELSFLETIARQLEAKGKTEKDPEVKKLKKKIDKSLQGLTGMVQGEAMVMEPQAQPSQMMEQQPMQQPQMGPGQQALMAILQKIQASRGM